MIQLKIQRPPSVQGESFVSCADWQRYRRISNPLRAVISQVTRIDFVDGFQLNDGHMTLIERHVVQNKVIKEDSLSNADQQLLQLYMDLALVCEKTNECKTAPDSGLILLPGHELPLLEQAQYLTVMNLLQSLAHPTETSVAVLTWRDRGGDRVLRVSSLPRLRAIVGLATKGQILHDLRDEDEDDDEGSTEADGQPSIEVVPVRKKRDKVIQPRTVSFCVEEILSDDRFRSTKGEQLRLVGHSVADAMPGDIICIHGHEILGQTSMVEMRGTHVEIQRQSRLPLE